MATNYHFLAKFAVAMRKAIIYLVLLVVLSGCHSSRKTIVGDDDIYGSVAVAKPHRDKPRVHAVPSSAASAVIEEGRRWLGVPYKYGGNDRGGVDCSGLTCAVFKKAAKIDLPRTSRDQIGACRRVKSADLRPGDLVFFTSSPGGCRINHVAIYIGDNQIIHSTLSLGVTISSLSEPYWDKHFHAAGRIL